MAEKIMTFPLIIKNLHQPEASSKHVPRALLFFAFFLFVSFLNADVVHAQKTGQEGLFYKKGPEPNVKLTPGERTWLEAHPNIRLGYVDNHEPQVIVNRDGTYSGIVVDLLKELNRRLGTGIRLEVYPIKTLIEKAKSKGIDGICNLHPEYADRLGMLKSQGYFLNYPAIFARSDLAFENPGDFSGKTVAIIDKAYFSEKIIRQYADRITVLKVKSASEGLRRLERGDVDLFIGISHNSYLISKYQLFDIVSKYIYTDYSDRVVISIRSDWSTLVNIVNKGLSTFSDGELNAIVAKWVNPPQPTETIQLTKEERRWLEAHPDIQLGYTDAFEPEVITNPDGTYSGMVVDFLDALNKKLGTAFGLRIYKIPQLIEKAKAKEVDGILNLHPEYADKLGLLKTRTYWPGYPAVFARRGVSFKGPDDFNGSRVAITDQVYFTEKLIQQYGEQATIVKVKNGLEGLQSVDTGDVDFFLGASFESYFITKYQLLGVVSAYVFLDSPVMFGIGIRSDWPQLLSILNKGIASFSEKEINDIIGKWS